MRGLILKDLFALKKSYIANLFWAILINLYCMMLAVGTAYGNFEGMQNFNVFIYISCFTPFLVGTASISSFHFDRESRFNEYELSLPISDKKKILSKYIIAGICLISSVFYLIFPVLCCLFTKQTVSKTLVYTFILVIQITALLICISIPANYLPKSGLIAFATKFSLFFWVLFSVLFGLYIVLDKFAEFINMALRRIAANMEITVFIIFIFVTVCFWISYKIAVKVHKRKRGEVV